MSKIDYASILSDSNRANMPVYAADVYALSDLGTAQIQGSATQLPAEALAVMVLLDAKATVGEIEQKALHIPSESLRNLLRSLMSAGLVRVATISEIDGLDFSAYFAAKPSKLKLSAGTKASAQREAQDGAPQLVRTGYYVSISRRAVKARTPAAGTRWSALVVEDDESVSALVARLLQGEGFDVKVAATRDEVVARLRTPPLPDVVILDVNLPDANGFEILGRLKTHSALKAVPVIMLTGETKRESVVRGLAGGADGYITKPFERANLLAGVKAVLGIAAA